MQEAGGGGGGGGHHEMVPALAGHYNNHAICDNMNIERSKIMLSEVRQLLHITLTIPVTSATAERIFSAMLSLKSLQ